MLTLERHWDYSGRDEDVSHEIYHDNAVLEFPQSGERFEGWRTSGSGVGQYPAHLAFHTRRITHRDDLVVVENLISYDGAPRRYTVNLLEFRATKWRTHLTSWTGGKRRSGAHLAGQQARGSTTTTVRRRTAK
jgi:hypothetical protein